MSCGLATGSGPSAGFSAAVYGASEALRTILFDDVAISGQSAASSRIENFLGFPTGVSGADLAFRAELQAIKFSARVAVPCRAEKFQPSTCPGYYEVPLDDGTNLLVRRSPPRMLAIVAVASAAGPTSLPSPIGPKADHPGASTVRFRSRDKL